MISSKSVEPQQGLMESGEYVGARILEEMRARARLYQALIEQSSDLIVILDKIGRFRYVSPSYHRVLGYSAEHLRKKTIFDLIHPDDLSQAITAFSAVLQSKTLTVRVTVRVRHLNGSWVILESSGRNCLDDPAINGIVAHARDVTERVAMEETLRYQTLHDALTDLPNRTFFLERLEQLLQDARQKDDNLALLMMDLDRFKDINDTFGHQYGDELLQRIAIRLRELAAEPDIVARLGGDEFAFLLPQSGEEQAREIIAILQATLEEPITIDGFPLQVKTSVGVVIYPQHGSDPLDLMRRADVAMYTAKRKHQEYAFYDPSFDQYSPRCLALVTELRKAINNELLSLYYQPKANLLHGGIYGVEALARWIHPEYGFIPPDQFIALAEQTGLITPLTGWVLETAIRQIKTWLSSGLHLSISVNLSMWDLRDAMLPEMIGAMLRRYNVPPHLLCIELTESAVMTDVEHTLDVLNRLFALGIRLAIDDFGTGYSSLAYLKRLPVDEIKIDRSFVQHMSAVRADATIVRATITMAHCLGMQVVAEGVEDAATWQVLRQYKCDAVQGYYLSRPLPASEFEDWLEESKPALAS